MKKYLVGFDAGTNSCRCSVFDLQGNEIASKAVQISPKCTGPGHFVYVSSEYQQAVYDSAKEALKNSDIDVSEIAGISCSSQRGALVMYDMDGNLLDTIIAGQDFRWVARQDEYLQAVCDAGITPDVFYDQYRYGMHLGTTCSLAELKRENPDEFRRIYKVGNMQLLLTRSLGSDGYYDEADDGNTTLAYDAVTHEKRVDILEALGLDPDLFADVYPGGTPCGSVTAEVASLTGFAEGTPVFVGSGDQMCNDVGAGCTEKGMASLCMGTIGVLDILCTEPPEDPERTVSVNTTPAGGFIAEGMCFACGGSYKWIKEVLCENEIEKAQKENDNVYELMNQRAAASVPGSNALIYLPFLQGTFAYNNHQARGAFIGLGYQHTKSDMLRAVMEGTAYDLRCNLELLIKATGTPPTEIRVTGGGRRSKLWLQIIADVLKVRLVNVRNMEAGTLGAAMIAGVGCGVFKDIKEASEKMVQVIDVIEPSSENICVYDKMYETFKACYKSLSQEVYNKLINIYLQVD